MHSTQSVQKEGRIFGIKKRKLQKLILYALKRASSWSRKQLMAGNFLNFSENFKVEKRKRKNNVKELKKGALFEFLPKTKDQKFPKVDLDNQFFIYLFL